MQQRLEGKDQRGFKVMNVRTGKYMFIKKRTQTYSFAEIGRKMPPRQQWAIPLARR